MTRPQPPRARGGGPRLSPSCSARALVMDDSCWRLPSSVSWSPRQAAEPNVVPTHAKRWQSQPRLRCRSCPTHQARPRRRLGLCAPPRSYESDRSRQGGARGSRIYFCKRAEVADATCHATHAHVFPVPSLLAHTVLVSTTASRHRLPPPPLAVPSPSQTWLSSQPIPFVPAQCLVVSAFWSAGSRARPGNARRR